MFSRLLPIRPIDGLVEEQPIAADPSGRHVMDFIEFTGSCATIEKSLSVEMTGHVFVSDIRAPRDTVIVINFYRGREAPVSTRIDTARAAPDADVNTTGVRTIGDVEAVLMDLDGNPIDAEWGFTMVVN